MGMAENEIGEGESVCLWAESKIVILLPDTVRAQCKRKPVYQTGPKYLIGNFMRVAWPFLATI